MASAHSKRSGLNGLSGPFSRRGPAECERCQHRTDATWPWSGWKTLRNCWLVLVGLLGVLAPVYMIDGQVMVPAALMVVMAIGPLNSLVSIKPTCLECGAVVSG